MFPLTQLVLIGFGAVCKSFITLVFKVSPHLLSVPILVIEPKSLDTSEIYNELKKRSQLTHLQLKLERSNHNEIFESYIQDHALVVELAWRIDTDSLVKHCQRKSCLFINTALDNWKHNDKALVEEGHQIMKKEKGTSTAVLNSGCNPGLSSSLVKKLLDNLDPSTKRSHSEKARHLGLTTIQISERDNQVTHLLSREQCFYNTWSVVGLIDEALLPARFSFGTHEKNKPFGATMVTKKPHQIELQSKCNHTRVKGYEPAGGDYVGTLIEHAEAYSLAEYLRSSDGRYSPSVYYSYLINDTGKLACWYMDYCLNKDLLPNEEHVLRSDEIISGYDSCGVLCFFKKQGKLKLYWAGSILSNEEAKQHSPEVNATALQVGIHVLATCEWMLMNPEEGVIEPESLDSDYIIDFCRPYLGKLVWCEVTDQTIIKTDQFTELQI